MADPRHAPVEVRFWRFVDPDLDSDECWPWQGAISTVGYGILQLSASRTGIASRVSYELHNGLIPKGLFVCHHCDNRSCVNPAHLFLGTPRDNSQDAARKGRFPRKLNEDQVRAIRSRYAAGVKQRVLAIEYGIDESVVSRIASGQLWAHVESEAAA